MQNTIPDSIDYLNLNGIMPYDIKAFIKDGVQTSLAPQTNIQDMMTGINRDEFTVSTKNTKENKKEGKSHKLNIKTGILGASVLFLAFTILKKKCPKIGEFTSKIGSSINKVFKK